MFIKDFFKKIKFWLNEDRIGPDMILTHWMLHYRLSMIHLCKSRFFHFDQTAELRPGAYAVWCCKISLGKRVVIRPGSMLIAAPPEDKGGMITIEDDVLTASGLYIDTSEHRFDNPNVAVYDQGYNDYRDVVIKRGAWIGAHCIILAGVTIGENSVIGAGSVVTKDIPPYCVAVGSPAKVIKVLK